jgi:hypothetical protein
MSIRGSFVVSVVTRIVFEHECDGSSITGAEILVYKFLQTERNGSPDIISSMVKSYAFTPTGKCRICTKSSRDVQCRTTAS